MSYVFVFIIHEDLNAALSGLVFSEDNSLLLLAVNPITLLGQGGVFCANIFGRSEKNYSVWLTQRENISEFFSRSKSLEISTYVGGNVVERAVRFQF